MRGTMQAMEECDCPTTLDCLEAECCLIERGLEYPDERMDEGAAIIVSLLVMIAVGILGLVWLGLKGLGVL